MKKKDKPETDEELLARYRELKKLRERDGKEFDLEKELCMALSRRFRAVSEKKLNRSMLRSGVFYYIVQLALIVLVIFNWDDLKIVLVLLLAFIWRSLNRTLGKLEINQVVISAALHWAHPTAEEDFFHSEHCYDGDTQYRVHKLVLDNPEPPPIPKT